MGRKKSYLTVTDCFCGAGGSSEGIRQATVSLGMNYGTDIQVEYALNHWKLAIETHNTNFPNTKHDCTDISACDPRRYIPTDILIGSPECTNHSVAKGQERVKSQLRLYENGVLDPAAERSRQTMWDIHRFAEYHNYRAIIVENVCDARMWVGWRGWITAMHDLGYLHKEVYLNSMFCWPTPQSRDRMYVVFWKKGNKAPDLEIRPLAFCPKCEKKIEARQRWKNGRTFGKYKRQYDYACAVCNTEVTPYYYAAFNAIDWSDLGTRIGDRNKPLSENTIRRIQYGIDKYCHPFTINGQQSTGIECRVNDVLGKLPTQSTQQSVSMVTPFLTLGEHSATLNVRNSMDAMQTQATRQTMGICTPFITESAYNSDKTHSLDEIFSAQTTYQNKDIVFPFIIEDKRSTGISSRVKSAKEQLSTIDASARFKICGFLTESYGNGKARSLTDELNAVTAGGIKTGLVTNEAMQSFLTYYYGSSQASHISEATDTISTKDRMALITGKVNIEDCYYRMLKDTEIQRGMAFPDEYKILGNAKEKTKQLGNAVTPPAEKILAERVFQSLM